MKQDAEKKAGAKEPRIENYICPDAAFEKMKSLQKSRRTTYIYGVTGVGKTAFVKEFLYDQDYLYLSVTDHQLPENAFEDYEDGIVVLDDIEFVISEEMRKQYAAIIRRLNARRDVWLILVSRAPVPKWLNPIFVRGLNSVITEADLILRDQNEFQRYFEVRGLYPLETTLEEIRQLEGLHPVFLNILSAKLKDLQKENVPDGNRAREEHKVIESARWLYYDYVESHVYESWAEDLQKFLMDVSIVPEFDLNLAQLITKKADAGSYILRAQEIGNFMEETEINGRMYYRMRSQLREMIFRRLQQKYPISYLNELYNSAGTGCEIEGNYLEALCMYEKSRNEEGISRILIENAYQHPGRGNYWEMRKYYLSLSEDIIERSPDLICAMSMLQSIMMNDEESDRWYEKLEEYIAGSSGNTRKNARIRKLYLDIALPQRGIKSLVDIFQAAGALLGKGAAAFPEFSVTNAQPSLMNGGKDFCEWSKHDRELAAALGGLVERVLGRMGKGLVSTALAESLFEKGGDNYEIASLAEKGRLQAESGGRLEIVFAAVGVITGLSLVNGKLNDAMDVLDGFMHKAEEDAPHLLHNMDAFRVRYSLYQGVNAEAGRWLEKAPDEKVEFSTLERFRYMVKVRVYLALNEYEQAFRLLQKMLYYSEKRERHYIHMECLLLLAILEYRRNNENWKITIQQAVSAAQEYRFVRVLTKEGAAAYELLKWDGINWKNQEYRRKVLSECKNMAEFYPAYLTGKGNGRVNLSDKALKILRMQAEGMSIEQIAQILFLCPSGVKYYTQDTYRKLGAKGKVAAITEARNRGLL